MTKEGPNCDSKGLTIGIWVTKLSVIGIFAMGVVGKLTGGADALAEALPGGMTAVYGIAAAEILAIILLLLPKTTLLGAGLATAIMAGAVYSHVAGPVGMDGEAGSMLPMAAFALVASVVTVVLVLFRKKK